MTKDVTRYHFVNPDDGDLSDGSPHPDGEWVKYEDYRRLAEQLAQSCRDARSDPEFGGCPLAHEPKAECASCKDWLALGKLYCGDCGRQIPQWATTENRGDDHGNR